MLPRPIFSASSPALLLAVLSATNCAATLVSAYDPDTSGAMQPNRYQISHGQRLVYFFVALGVLGLCGVTFLVVSFCLDYFEKKRAKEIDHERCIRHIKGFEDKCSGPVNAKDTVFDFHYYPSSQRPDHVVTNEMASVDDKTIGRIRRKALQRRQMENASRSTVQMARAELRANQQASIVQHLAKMEAAKAANADGFAAGGGGVMKVGGGFSVDDPLGGGGDAFIGIGSHGAGLTTSGGDQAPHLLHVDTAPVGAIGSALAARNNAAGNFYTAADNDYFGFGEDLDFELQQ